MLRQAFDRIGEIMERMKALFEWGWASFMWLIIGAWLILVGLIIVVGGFTLYIVTAPSEFSIRCIGVMMQLSGFIMTVYGPLSKLKVFKVQPIREWWNRRPRYPSKARIVDISATVPIEFGGMGAVELRAELIAL